MKMQMMSARQKAKAADREMARNMRAVIGKLVKARDMMEKHAPDRDLVVPNLLKEAQEILRGDGWDD